MAGLVLQLGGLTLQLGGLTATQLVFGASELLSVALGLTISYIAYRGYRRNDARPMLFVSLGFVLVLGVPALAAGVYLLAQPVEEVYLGAVTQVSELLGLVSILYGLRAD